ncbi:helix-turn-helix domain-containing protein [Paenibacillus elgii]|uniref:helix-turn-helix domain-containing protein n=1 Tax=Paenibacillus elgii TaxID=189691 RepID=UPI00203FAED4|nr:helix-turn-helix transcriptional regulator [Paenibacillus elgii]MCM3272601.1 helix-turn-helix transcriptional regulator [Paenibacillus elgii]
MRYKLGRCFLPEIWKEIGWTNQDFAERMDMSRQQASDYGTGKKKMGTALTFAAADTMGVDPRRIYELIPIKQSERRKQRSTKSTT